jgi:hypothetical protein
MKKQLLQNNDQASHNEYRFFADEVWCDDPAVQEWGSNSMR